MQYKKDWSLNDIVLPENLNQVGQDLENLDDEIKKNQEKLLSLIEKWNAFIEHGGTVGGSFIIKNGGFGIEADNKNRFYLILNESNQLILNRDGNSNNCGIAFGDTALAPTESNKKDLGANSLAFKDLWLSAFRKEAHGYTKMPNGYIYQWGYVEQTHTDGYVNFPIAFPNKNTTINLSISCQGDSWGGNPYYQSLGNTRFRLVYLNKTSKPGKVLWEAWGY